MPRGLTTLLLALLAQPALAQLSTAPVLAGPPNVNYPPIAKAAHVSGEVTVTFAINPDGTTTSVQVISGPEMLRAAVADPIKKWRFKTPLPLNSQTYFEAKYTFRMKTDADDEDEDDLDNPPYVPCCGDMISVSAAATTLIGDVHSVDGSQIVDVTATAPAKADDRCPKDTNKQTPDKTDFSDYVELLRNNCWEGCTRYRVRVYRNGRITWRGFDGVIAKGDQEAVIGSSAAETLLNNFQTDEFWSACSVPPVPDPAPRPAANPGKGDDSSQTDAGDDHLGNYLTASIGGATKTVLAWQNTFSNADALAWRIDRAADTHRWRHVDPATEPYTNMYEDLEMPKPGMTLLIRATRQFNPYTAQQTFTHLKKLLNGGEPVNAADASGWTALMYASNLDSDDDTPVKLLLDAHADPNIASLHGDTALMFAAYRHTLSQPLLDHGANLNAHNADGLTPLMLLAQHSDPDELKAALAAGADPNAHDNLGRTALDYLIAVSCGRPIVPFPGPPLHAVPFAQPPCANPTPGFLQSQSLVQAAMKAATNP